MEYNTSNKTGNKIQTPKKRGMVKKEMENQLDTWHLINLAYEIPVTVLDIMVFAVSISLLYMYSHYGTHKYLLSSWFDS